MQAFDASSIVHAWDNYPLDQFPPLWKWIAGELNERHIMLPAVAFKEVGEVAPDCAGWLESVGVGLLPMTEEILLEAQRIKGVLGIEGDRYGAGVDEKDLFIIATARIHKVRLVSNEGVQNVPPKMTHNYKIPAVCKMAAVSVECVNFVEFMRQSKAVFG